MNKQLHQRFDLWQQEDFHGRSTLVKRHKLEEQLSLIDSRSNLESQVVLTIPQDDTQAAGNEECGLENLARIMGTGEGTVVSFVDHQPQQCGFGNQLDGQELADEIVDLRNTDFSLLQVEPQEEIEVLELLDVISNGVFGHVSVMYVSFSVVTLPWK